MDLYSAIDEDDQDQTELIALQILGLATVKSSPNCDAVKWKNVCPNSAEKRSAIVIVTVIVSPVLSVAAIVSLSPMLSVSLDFYEDDYESLKVDN